MGFKMKKSLVLGLFFSTSVFAAYKQYNPHTDKKYIDKAISGACKKEHQRYDDLDYSLKMNVGNMKQDDVDKLVSELKDAERKRWICINNELNKNNIDLNLNEIFKDNNI